MPADDLQNCTGYEQEPGEEFAKRQSSGVGSVGHAGEGLGGWEEWLQEAAMLKGGGFKEDVPARPGRR